MTRRHAATLIALLALAVGWGFATHRSGRDEEPDPSTPLEGPSGNGTVGLATSKQGRAPETLPHETLPPESVRTVRLTKDPSGEVPTTPDPTSHLFTERLRFDGTDGEATGKQVLAQLKRYAVTEFASADVRESFLAEQFPLAAGKDESAGILGADLFMQVRERGYEIEVRGDRFLILEVPHEED